MDAWSWSWSICCCRGGILSNPCGAEVVEVSPCHDAEIGAALLLCNVKKQGAGTTQRSLRSTTRAGERERGVEQRVAGTAMSNCRAVGGEVREGERRRRVRRGRCRGRLRSWYWEVSLGRLSTAVWIDFSGRCVGRSHGRTSEMAGAQARARLSQRQVTKRPPSGCQDHANFCLKSELQIYFLQSSSKRSSSSSFQQPQLPRMRDATSLLTSDLCSTDISMYLLSSLPLPAKSTMMTILKYLLFPTKSPMMKFMLFGLLTRGELVTCQYMLSETRSNITVVFHTFKRALTDSQRFSRLRVRLTVVQSGVEERLMTLMAGTYAP